MADPYRIFGAEVSPYSVKVRSYFRYKQIPHEWIVRNASTLSEYKKYAKLPLIPAVATPDGQGLQDSTPILLSVEALHPEPSIHPQDPALAFLSALLEEFGDEWGNKWMFHLRWWREADQQSVARRIAPLMLPEGAGEEQVAAVAGGIVERMTGRRYFVGSSEATADQIESSFREGVARIEAHLASRPYLFGGRPAFADFGLWGQLYNAWTDPTGGEIIRGRRALEAWIERMLAPAAEGEFEGWEALAPTLEPILREDVGARFLPWSDANARALAAGESEFSVEIAGQTYTQQPQKYHAKSLAALRQRYAGVEDRAALDPILERSGCLAWLQTD